MRKVKRTYNAFGQRVYSQASLANLGLNAPPPVVGQAATAGSTAAAATAAGTAASPTLAPTHAAALRARGKLGAGGSEAGAAMASRTAAAAAGTQAPTWTVVATRHFLHDDLGRLVGEYPVSSPSLATQETVWFNGLPVAAMIGGVLYHVHADHLAAPRSLTRASDGLEMWRWNSDPFGSTFPTFPSGTIITYNLRFPGQQFDDDTGLHYNWMRDYSAVTGRYLQADPLGLEGGLARYGYAQGNPLSLIDPTGLIPPESIVACISDQMGDINSFADEFLGISLVASGLQMPLPGTSGIRQPAGIVIGRMAGAGLGSFGGPSAARVAGMVGARVGLASTIAAPLLASGYAGYGIGTLIYCACRR